MKSIKSVKTLFLCVWLAMMMTLTGCLSSKPSAWPSGSSALANYLYLKKGDQIPTSQGIYQPQKDEVWASMDVVRQKDETILLLMEALKRRQIEGDIK